MSQAKLFGTDGVRGVANQYPITPEVAIRLGRAVATVLLRENPPRSTGSRPVCVVGRDTRASCDMLAGALAAGLNSVGVDVVDAGVVPTPAVAYLTRHLEALAGGVISASHNPFSDNGIKFFAGTGYKLTVETEAEVEALTLAQESQGISGLPTGGEIGRSRDLTEGDRMYIDFAMTSVGGTRLDGLKVALDNANGAASFTSAAILKELGADVSVYFSEPDGVNINENCGCTHPETIKRLVTDSGAQVGVSHDGDADRVILVDENGCVCDGDDILAIAASYMIPKGELVENTIVSTVMSNYGLDAFLEQLGGTVIRTGVGDRAVITAMREGGYNVGGEPSGHLIFHDHNTTGDGIISALQILRIMKLTGKLLSELKSQLKKFPQILRNISVSSKPPVETLTEAQKLVAETEAGLSGKGRAFLRYSGTEPKIRLLIEGVDVPYMEAQADKISQAVVDQIG